MTYIVMMFIMVHLTLPPIMTPLQLNLQTFWRYMIV